MPRKQQTETSSESLASLLDELPQELAAQAFTHASWVDHRADCYERLAFLGDVVLSLSVSTHLYPRLDAHGAGRLTQVRAQAVSGASCARVADGLGVVERLRSVAPAGQGRGVDILLASERVLASVCEAVIGAAYLAFGFERVAPAVVEANERLASAVSSSFEFLGNVEGTDLAAGAADVVVADGFTGNVALKTLEGACAASSTPRRPAGRCCSGCAA